MQRDIREAARLEEGDHLEAEVTESGDILLKPVSVPGREPSPEQEAEILAAVDEARSVYAVPGRVLKMGRQDLTNAGYRAAAARSRLSSSSRAPQRFPWTPAFAGATIT